MTNYTTRVELHGATSDDYDDLHEAMADKGFVRWIKFKSGKKQLPTAEYNMAGTSLTVDEVQQRAEDAANSVKAKPTPYVLTTESSGRRAAGLKDWKD